MSPANAPLVAAIRLAPGDTVAVVIAPVAVGQTIQISDGTDTVQTPASVVATGDIPIFHKVALASVSSGTTLVRNGTSIGMATCDIHAGDCVHVHNLRSLRARQDGETSA